ncbi:MAG: peptidylprolyl isomerase [Acidobacteriota bacterium]|nr:peptidylprolyl isomerase [Acidobacteriota bacterium]
MPRQLKWVNIRYVVLVLATIMAAGEVFAQEDPVAVSGRPSEPNGQILQRILVKVNGDIITQTDLERGQVEAIRQGGLRATTEAELLQALVEVTPRVISAAVDELLIVQQGRELGYHLSDEQFQDLVESIKTENNFANDEEFREALMQSEGMNVDDLRQTMERQMLINQVQQVEILRKVVLTDSEAREHYENNLNEYTEPETITMREILIRVAEGIGGTVNVAADDQARYEAEEARLRILAGEDFSLVAIAVSDAASKANGGLIGPIDLTFVNDAVQTALLGLEKEEISQPVRTPVGYHILQLVERTEPTPLPFEEVRDTIGNSVFSERRVKEYRSYIDRLRNEAVIEWKDPQLEEVYLSYDSERDGDIIIGG